MLHRQSIKRKLVLIIMLTSSIALLLAGAAFVVYELISFRQAMKDNLLSMASMVGETSTAALLFDDPATAKDILVSLGQEPHIVAACLYNKDGKPVAWYTRAKKQFSPPSPIADSYTFTSNDLHLFKQIRHKGERLGTIYIQSDLEELTQRLWKYLGIMVVVLFTSMLVALVVSARLQRVISIPIQHLAEAARRVSKHKDYTLRVNQTSEDEVGHLVAGFNGMLAQIQHRDEALEAARDGLEKRVQERTSQLESEVAERKRAEEGLKQQLTRISLLNSITRAIADRQDLDSVVQVVLRQLEDHLPIDFGRVYLYDAHTKTNAVAAHGSGPPVSSYTGLFAANTSLVDTGLQACLNGETLVFEDTANEGTPLSTKLHRIHLRSALAVPLIVEKQLFGILLTARREPKSFSSGECEFLRMLSEQVALAAHQARLHTQLQQAYNELKETQQAVMQEERLRALGQMASGIAHDINNALCPIVVYSDLLLQSRTGMEAGAVRQLQNIKTAGEDIAHIVSRMREFYRKREDQDSLTEVSLNKMAIQVVDLTRPRWRDIPQARGITIQMQTDLDGKVPEIPGNESEIREAITNLILNAVDAMPDGGTLTLRTRVLGFDPKNREESNRTHVSLEVCDTGMGMSEETRKRCLEPFFSTKGKHGTGLGLAMVYGIVERHEGRIEIDSTLGRGTTIRIVFPVRERAKKTAEPERQTAAPMPCLKVLCIDDEPLLRDMLKQILENGGLNVQVADGGQAGLELFRKARQQSEPFDVVITDLGMPYVDGNQVSKAVKSESATTPIIMLTGWGTIMKEDGDLPTQVDGVLCKPPKIAELFGMIRKVATPGHRETPPGSN
jgi:signal transduction histidine kinase/ActR/RegA family two-component response regulator/HAMP domain-containing protein